MPLLYVDTNFLLQLSLDEEHASLCGMLLDSAGQHRLEMVLPVFAIFESLFKQSRDVTEHKKQAARWSGLVRELTRTRKARHQEIARTLGDAAVAFGEVADLNDKSLAAVIDRLGTATPIPLDRDVMTVAFSTYRGTLEPGDAVIVASVIGHARKSLEPAKYFFTLDTDFHGDAQIAKDLAAVGVKLLPMDYPRRAKELSDAPEQLKQEFRDVGLI